MENLKEVDTNSNPRTKKAFPGKRELHGIYGQIDHRMSEVPDTYKDDLELEKLFYCSEVLQEHRKVVDSIIDRGGYEPCAVVDLFRAFYRETVVNTLYYFTKKEQQNGYWGIGFIKGGVLKHELTTGDLIKDEKTKDLLDFVGLGIVDMLSKKD
jgi:hypothetical protein